MISDMLNNIINLLPLSPFRSIINNLENSAFHDFMCLLNWFVPISEIITILELYAAAIAVYYLWSVLLRFVNAIR